MHNWAYDMSINGNLNPEIVNEDVINQSIEMILATPINSRLFNLNFGSMFSLRIFDNLDVDFLKNIITDTVKAIERWEDRITIIPSKVKLIANNDQHSVKLSISYIIKQTNTVGEFSKIIMK